MGWGRGRGGENLDGEKESLKIKIIGLKYAISLMLKYIIEKLRMKEEKKNI